MVLLIRLLKFGLKMDRSCINLMDSGTRSKTKSSLLTDHSTSYCWPLLRIIFQLCIKEQYPLADEFLILRNCLFNK